MVSTVIEWRRVEMRCGGKKEKVARKSLSVLIYGATLLLSQRARVPATHAMRELEDRSGVSLPGDFRACTCALWDRSRVALYITLPGDF